MNIYLRAFAFALGLNALFALAPSVLLATTPSAAEADGAALVFAMRALTPWLALLATIAALVIAALAVGAALRTMFRAAGHQPSPWALVWLQMLAALAVALVVIVAGLTPDSQVLSPAALGLIQMVTSPLGALLFVDLRASALPTSAMRSVR
jgi:hypothetical protein